MRMGMFEQTLWLLVLLAISLWLSIRVRQNRGFSFVVFCVGIVLVVLEVVHLVNVIQSYASVAHL